MVNAEKSRWKPPIPLLIIDALGLALLALGLLMHFSPDAAVSQVLPPGVRLPLLIIGGVLFAVGWGGILLSLLGRYRN
jgi:hypothetical protein